MHSARFRWVPSVVGAYGTKNGFLARIPRQNGQAGATFWRDMCATISHGHCFHVSFVACCALHAITLDGDIVVVEPGLPG